MAEYFGSARQSRVHDVQYREGAGFEPRRLRESPATVPRVSRVIPGPEGTALRATRSKRSGSRTGGNVFHLPGGGNKSSGNKVIKAEFVAALVIIALRMVADYVPNDDASKPGKEKPTKGLSPFPLALVFTFLFAILGMLSDAGPRMARISGAFGALLVMGLLFNSADELKQIGDWADNFKTDQFAAVAGGAQAGSTGEDITPAPPTSGDGSTSKTTPKTKVPKPSGPSGSSGYYFFPLTGGVQRQQNSILASLLAAAGWHGAYDTQKEAEAAYVAYAADHSKPKL